MARAAHANGRSLGPVVLVAGCAVVVYTHAGYPLLVSALARRRRRRAPAPPVVADESVPTVSVVTAAFDEESVIGAKIANGRALDYPADKLELLVVSDGSTDDTAAIARSLGARVVEQPRLGKSAAVNRGIAAAAGELVILTDANCALNPDAVRAIVTEFIDPRVAVVSGAQRVPSQGTRGTGEGLYRRIESRVKSAESEFGATMGAPGTITGVRRSLFQPIPPHVINDDFYICCDALRRGWRVRYAAGAVATHNVSLSLADDLERRTRSAAGTWQTTIESRELADPRRGWAAVAFISHWILRSLVVPALLPVIWVASVVLAHRSRLARVLAGAQTLFYATAILGSRVESRMLAVPYQFGLMNLTALRGGWRFLSKSQPVAWQKTRRRVPLPGGREG